MPWHPIQCYSDPSDVLLEEPIPEDSQQHTSSDYCHYYYFHSSWILPDLL
jgi:hypothetical protein